MLSVMGHKPISNSIDDEMEGIDRQGMFVYTVVCITQFRLMNVRSAVHCYV